MIRQIDHFDISTGWTKVPDPLGDWKKWDDALDAAGYETYGIFGKESTTHIYVYHRSEPIDPEFLVGLWTFDSGQAIAINNFPSLIQLCKDLTPIVQVACIGELSHIADELHELLTQYRCGPLGAPLAAKHNQLLKAKIARDSA